MTDARASYSLLRRLTLTFALVAALVFALTGTYLYRSLSAELQRRDDIEISGKLSQFLQMVRESGSTRAVRAAPAIFHEVLLSHPGVYLGIYDANNEPLLEHTDKPCLTLKGLVAAAPPSRTPYACAPEGIGASRCVFAEEKLPSGETIRVSVVRTANDRQSLLRSYRVDIWLAVAVGAALLGALGYRSA